MKNRDSIHIRNRSATHPAGRESYPKTAQSAIATHTYQEAVRRWSSQPNMFRNPTCIMVDTCLEQVSTWHKAWVDILHKKTPSLDTWTIITTLSNPHDMDLVQWQRLKINSQCSEQEKNYCWFQGFELCVFSIILFCVPRILARIIDIAPKINL